MFLFAEALHAVTLWREALAWVVQVNVQCSMFGVDSGRVEKDKKDFNATAVAPALWRVRETPGRGESGRILNRRQPR